MMSAWSLALQNLTARPPELMSALPSLPPRRACFDRTPPKEFMQQTDEILIMLAGGAMTTAEVAKAMRMSNGQAECRLRRLVIEGCATRVKEMRPSRKHAVDVWRIL